MQVDELLPYLREHQTELVGQLRNGKYKPNPVRRVEIPKEEKGKFRKCREYAEEGCVYVVSMDLEFITRLELSLDTNMKCAYLQ